MPAGKYDHHPELRPIHEPLNIVVLVEPVAKGRARVNINGGKIHSYTPTKTKEAEDYLKAYYSQYRAKAFDKHIPVKLSVTFFRQKPRWSLKRDKLPVRKPDTDNFIKLCLDSLNGILVYDDSQITTIYAKKVWANDGIGKIELRLEEDL